MILQSLLIFFRILATRSWFHFSHGDLRRNYETFPVGKVNAAGDFCISLLMVPAIRNDEQTTSVLELDFCSDICGK